MSIQCDFAIDWMRKRNPETVAYVGWRPGSNCAPLQWCIDNGKLLTVIEAYAPNADAAHARGYNVIPRRIDDMVASRNLGSYSCLIWLHGPEHVSRDVMWYTLGGVVARCPHVLIQAPIGEDPQGAYQGNPYEVHKQALVSRDFYRMGWETAEHPEETTFSAWVG